MSCLDTLSHILNKAVHIVYAISLPVLQVFKILDSFKASFVHALSVGMPAALCDSCPLQLLHTLCKNLEGMYTHSLHYPW